jgi:hypothetical protein
MPNDHLRFVWDRATKTPLENQLIEVILAMYLTNRLKGREERHGQLTPDDGAAAVKETITWANATFPGLHVTQSLSS